MKFKDTQDGARACFQHVTGKPVPEGAQVIPDPFVRGVWAIRDAFPGEPEPDAVVYLAGHKNPWGRVREDNDVEAGVLPSRDYTR